jgi:phage terminase large subunit
MGAQKVAANHYLGCSLITGDALMYPGTNYFIARKKLNDLRKYTLPSIYEVLTAFGISKYQYKYNGQDNVLVIKHPEGANGEDMDSRIFLLEAAHLPSDPLYYRFGSMQMTRGMIEEAGEFVEAAKNNLHASVGRWRNDVYGIIGKIIQTCNPSKNYLYKSYYKANKDNTLPDWRKFIQALPQDNKMLPDGYLETLNQILSPNEKERLLKGNWEYDDDPAALIEYECIVNLFSNTHVEATGKGVYYLRRSEVW